MIRRNLVKTTETEASCNGENNKMYGGEDESVVDGLAMRSALKSDRDIFGESLTKMVNDQF